MSNLITLTTDFGMGEYVAAMKAVILNLNPKARIIDITHMIRPQSIQDGAYVLYSTAPYFHNAIHVGVVDPGVGTDRAGIIIECKSDWFVGPDNGLLIPSARKLGLEAVYKITNKSYLGDEISNTFHGRDIFAQVAAHLSTGFLPSELGILIRDYQDLKLEYYGEEGDTLCGKLLYVDRFGNLIFSIPKEIVSKYLNFGDNVTIEVGNEDIFTEEKVRFLQSYGHAEKGRLLATISSSNFLEIACNQGSAVGVLKVAPISKITLRF